MVLCDQQCSLFDVSPIAHPMKHCHSLFPTSREKKKKKEKEKEKKGQL